MGQYYKIIFLSDIERKKEIIRMCIIPNCFNECGSKLMEHSYINNKLVNFIEYLLCPKGMFYMSRVVWAGDYADNEYDEDTNLYNISGNISNNNIINYNENINTSSYKYIINHTKQMFINKDNLNNEIHPLPLLLSEGNGRGGGDYNGCNQSLCGSWSRDIISLEEELPEYFVELICNFEE